MKKQLSLLLGGLLLASSLVACGAKGSTASTTAATSDKETAAESTTAKEGESKAEGASSTKESFGKGAKRKHFFAHPERPETKEFLEGKW